MKQRVNLAVRADRVEPRDSLDFYPTPPWATRALCLRVLREQLGFDRLGTVEDPCCGEGHMAAPLSEFADSVRASDVFPYGFGDVCDYLPSPGFLDPSDAAPRPDWTIFNPPFVLALPFILKALDRSKVGVAAFVRLQFLETDDRYSALWGPRPPTVVAFFSERVALHKGVWKPKAGSMTAYCWLVWVRGMAPRPPFWIPPGQKAALMTADDIRRFGWKGDAPLFDQEQDTPGPTGLAAAGPGQEQPGQVERK